MSKSILQPDRSRCYLCGGFECGDHLDKHHVFGGANRPLSEKYGLYVYLHHGSCHIFGKYAAHNDENTMLSLRQSAQKTAMDTYGWAEEDFRRIFGKNYL